MIDDILKHRSARPQILRGPGSNPASRSFVRNHLSALIVPVLVLASVRAGVGQTYTTFDPKDAAIEAQVDGLLVKLSLEQKLEMLGGHDGFYIHAEPTIGLPALRMADGPVGIRTPGPSTAYPAGIALAATFDTDLAYQEGTALGRDARARGISFLLGPGVNIYRSPMNGRNFEYFGEDPFLASRLAVSYINGLQKQGVSGTIKHFALNNEEYDRHHIDSIVDERTLHELYLPAFEAAVKEAHVGAIMNSYNLVNGVHASQNSELNVKIAKQDWGFKGIIMSDWNSVYDGLAAANGGLDLEMPSAKFMNASTLGPALTSGALTQATLDDKIRRILRVSVRMGWLNHPDALHAPKDDPLSRAVARKVALESITLLKNDNNLLPLDPTKLCTLAIIGPNADKPVVGGGGSAQVTPVAAISTIEAFTAALSKTASCPGVVYARGLPSNEEIFQTTTFAHGITQQLFTATDATGKPAATSILEHLVPVAEPAKEPAQTHSARWVADYTPTTTGAHIIFVAVGHQDSITLVVNGHEALSILQPEGRPVISATVDGVAGQPLHLELIAQLHAAAGSIGLGIRPVFTLVSDEAKGLASKADAVIIAAGYDAQTEGEGFDRSFSLPCGQNELIREIGARNKNTIVTIDAGGGFEMPWLSSVPALLHLWYPGEEGAPALADLIFGKANPEGHLPISIERTFADNPTHNSYYPGPGSTPDHPQIKLVEGVFLGYRYYADSTTKPLFPFGYGLSYTNFAYSHLRADTTPQGVVVSLDVKNIGTRAGGEAVQIYVSDPSATIKRPSEELKAFRKVHLEPKDAVHLEFTLDRRAFSYWSVETYHWQVDPGKFTILAGDASDHLPLSVDIDLPANPMQPKPMPQALSQSPTLASPISPTQAKLFPVNPAPAYNGTKEFSLSIKTTKLDKTDGTGSWIPPESKATRVMEQLAGFTPKIVATDKYGGRIDMTQPATGFYYTKRVGDRWYAIDPEGHPYIHMAVVELSPGSSPHAKDALKAMYGDQATWMAKTQAMLLQHGFNGAGAWSNIDLIRNSPLQAGHPLAYTVILNLMANYGKKRGGLHDTPGHAGFPHDTIFVFDLDFPKFVDEAAKSIQKFADDPNLFGYFSDNELPLNRNNLDGYLTLPHDEPGYVAAKKWMDDHHAGAPTDDLRKEFLAYEVDIYYSIVSSAIRKNDPHHMYIGSRITGKTEQCPEVFHVLGKYADAISVNYYNSWTPDSQLLAMWEHESGKPEMITEWYVKGNDSGMPNKTGAGWLVGTQAERGDFYQNYALELIQSKTIVGWHWFKYQDNDPLDPHAELSNRDANKGVVNIKFQQYAPLLERMKQLNPNVYALADYFDTRHQ
jgi:beta-glucosidase